MPGSRVKIGIDFHGVITCKPEYFSKFTQLAVARGYEIHIITGGPGEVIKKMLDDWHISYTSIFAILDFYDVLHKVKYFENGEFHVDNELWDTAKGLYCKEHDINIHIDDSTIYRQWFSTPYCLYDAEDACCSLAPQKCINFSEGPESALDQIAGFVTSQNRQS